MKYSTLEVNFDLNDKNEYVIKSIKSDALVYNDISCLSFFLDTEEEKTYYVNDLNKFYIYVIKWLLDNGYCNIEDKKKKSFSFVYHSGNCANIKVKTENGVNVYFVNFKNKFGLDYQDEEINKQLIEYAIAKGRIRLSLGSDAFHEFIATIFSPKRYRDYVAHNLIRNEDHYPIFEYTQELLEAKENVTGYQMCIRGSYTNIIEYDLESSYPAQLLNNMPIGKPYFFDNLEDVPNSYFKVITFTYFNCKLKPNKIDFVDTSNYGRITLTEALFELFIENYSTDIQIKQIQAFKTQKSPFKKFVFDNIINGKKNEHRKHISKYNKYIGNSIIGYFGRNSTLTENIAHLEDGLKMAVYDKQIEPIYLPVYLAVLDKAKASFIRTLQKNKQSIIYANTDGFLSTTPIDTTRLNIYNTGIIGNYRPKNIYQYIYIDCINGYSGILDTGEIDNTISGMTFEDLLAPEAYQKREFKYYINTPTPDGTIRKQTVQLHQ